MAKKSIQLGDAVIYILLAFFIAGFSLFAFLVFEEATWAPDATGSNGRGMAKDYFTWSDEEKHVPSLARTTAGKVSQNEKRDRPIEVSFAGTEREESDVAEAFEWGECTLRELEENLTNGIQEWKPACWKEEGEPTQHKISL